MTYPRCAGAAVCRTYGGSVAPWACTTCARVGVVLLLRRRARNGQGSDNCGNMKHTILPLQLLVQPSLDDVRPLILYHGRRCSDGFGAALAAWLFYGDKAEYRGLDHGEIQCAADLGEDLQARAVYVVDFAFEPALMAEIEALVSKLVVLDHHKSAAEKLQGFQCRCGQVHFDMQHSGARLAWEFFHPDKPVPGLIRYIEDRDIWKWEFAESAAFLSALEMEPHDLQRWAEIAAFTPEQEAAFMARGGAMDEKIQKLCADIAKSAHPLVFNGVQGLMANCPGLFHSQVGDILARETGTFALMWSANEHGAKLGLRSRSGFDCIPLAESLGGGGHAQACGCKLGHERLVELLSGHFRADPQADYPEVLSPALQRDEQGKLVRVAHLK